MRGPRLLQIDWAWILFLNFIKALDVELAGVKVADDCKFMEGFGWKSDSVSVDFKGVTVMLVGVLRRLVRALVIVRTLGGANDSARILLGVSRTWYRR
eukprot:COSAG01_NODE_16969_length_1189_cov_1.459633_1_plen_98_part_00